ncbi:hypothetical protein [Trinickia dinghuensis]|uniref:Uncharacterized protein n=1 Tax=Trinickia dinghuensis TaxID=2291023 RepID=A0A3D8JTK2_9BURK|nr:hypothetical protein [Trinickia dinghuensis]RDU96122.1 hypothetical protein DWV00_26175 [Trinickia dinghuensis]
MKPSEFHIGLEFICGPFWWRCTDVGTRTVAAIRLVEEDPVWYQGPPYMVKEVVLDATELEDAHLTERAHILASLEAHRSSGHPGFPHEAVSRMMDERVSVERYPRKRLFDFDRVREDGEILHPYAGRKDGGAWVIRLYLPFTKQWVELGEAEFIALPLCTPDAVRRRADSC